MVLELLREWFPDTGDVPNRFTIAMGQLIREARLEAQLSQNELAQQIYRVSGRQSQ